MRRSGFKPKLPERKPAKQMDYQPRPRAKACRIEGLVDRACVPVPKVKVWQDEAYMNLVRAMPCIRCNAPPRSQFCHADEGKGVGFKSDCRLGWPGCAACHYAVGTQRIYPKEARRALEADYGRRTRAAIIAAGAWPANLPMWDS